MPIVTRSQRNKQSEMQPKSSMNQRLSNPFEGPHLEDTEISEELLQECQESASFQKLVERLMENDKEKYLLMLTSKGVKLPDDFDTDIFRTRSQHYDYQEQQREEQNTPEQHIPEQNIPEQHIPKQNIPEKNIPKQNIPFHTPF